LKYGLHHYDNSSYEYVLSSAISKGLTKYAEQIFYVNWNGFRMCTGQIDNIHILTQITEKAFEYNIEKNVLFIGFWVNIW
jgi:hypothetical protein